MNRIVTKLGTGTVSNFGLQEFTSMHESVLESLERVRAYHNHSHGGGVWIRITGAALSPVEHEALGDRLGWIDEGGPVSRTSKHRTDTKDADTSDTIGCCAVDFEVLDFEGERLPEDEVAAVNRLYFDYEKHGYADGHHHGDNRYKTGAAKKG